ETRTRKTFVTLACKRDKKQNIIWSCICGLSSEEQSFLGEITKNMVKPSYILLTIKDQDKLKINIIRTIYNANQILLTTNVI
ncbi:hypothetical protein CR513_12030, partial [Mucuna pruriens]